MQGRNVTKRKKKGQVQTRFSHALGSVVCDCSLYSIGSRSGSTFWVEGSKEAAARKALCVCPLCVLLSRRESSQTAAHEGGRGGEEWNTRNLLLNGWIRPHCYESQFTFPGQALEILFMLNRLHLACVKMTEAWIMNDLPPLQEVVIIEIIAKRRSLWTGPGAACFEAPRGAQAVSAGPGLPHSHSHCEGKKEHFCPCLWAAVCMCHWEVGGWAENWLWNWWRKAEEKGPNGEKSTLGLWWRTAEAGGLYWESWALLQHVLLKWHMECRCLLDSRRSQHGTSCSASPPSDAHAFLHGRFLVHIRPGSELRTATSRHWIDPTAPADTGTTPLTPLMAACTRARTALQRGHSPPTSHSHSWTPLSSSHPTVSASIYKPPNPAVQVGLDSSHHQTASLLADSAPFCFY